MEANEFKTSQGNCIISEEVIASIARTAALEVNGVAGMATRRTDIRGMIASRAVTVINNENETVLDVYILLKQGAKIQEVCAQVQKDVKVAVQSMTGKPVTRVNVHIEGLKLEEKEA